MGRESTRRRVRGTEADAPRNPAPAPQVHPLLALQRGAGNQAVARLLERDGTLHAPASWFDRETHHGPGRATLRHLHTTQPNSLVAGLRVSLPHPQLFAVSEVTKDNVPNWVLAGLLRNPGDSGSARNERRFVRQAQYLLESHTDLLELEGADPQAPPRPRKIMRPLDLMPEPDDLAGAAPQMLQSRWCALIALVKSESKPVIRAFLQQEHATAPWHNANIPLAGGTDLQFYRALHTYFYEHKGVEYDDISNRPKLLVPFGYTLKYVGPTGFDQLWRAQLRTGRHYIIDIKKPDHTMHATMNQDFTAPLAPGQNLSAMFTFDNDGTNYNQPLNTTIAAKVLNVFEK